MLQTESSSRRFGVLLPISALPGRGPIGTLGRPARKWLEWLRRAEASLWQVLPVGPVGYGNSPYSSLSSFAANPQLLSVEGLLEAGWVDEVPGRLSPGGHVDYEAASARLEPLLSRGWVSFAGSRGDRRDAFEDYRRDPAQQPWLDDWCLFATFKARFGGAWWDWPEPLRLREPSALAEARGRLADELGFHAFVQFLLAEQSDALRHAAGQSGIEILGDLPFYPALDSADVWSRPDLFDLDGDGRPRQVAGVPPDAFCSTGQLWGNPVYRWDRHAEDDYRWWRQRVAASLRFVDWLRLDHFRAFESYWAVPAGRSTAVEGRWLAGPGSAFFEAMGRTFGDLPFVAEDLGVITDAVRSLRENLGILGMRVLQFGFETADSEHAPERVPRDAIAYTGTHDNDTTRGWFSQLRGAEKRRALAHLREPGRPHWSLLEVAMESAAEWAIAPIQDLLGLGSEARLNEPGLADGQWTWRLESLPPDALAREVRQLVEATAR